MKDIFLSVIIPAYNEEANIRNTLKEVSAYLAARGFRYEIIVVDDGSLDNTYEQTVLSASGFNDFRILKNPDNKGKGYSVKRAVLASGGKYILFMDADNSTSIYEFDKFLPYLEQGYDVVIASRRLKESQVDTPQPFLRAVMGKFFIFISRVTLNLRARDFNCGFKAYKSASTRRIFELQSMDGWSFDVELLFLVNKLGLKLKEVPVRWVHKSGSKVKPFRDAVRSFASIIKIKVNDVRHRY